jgi:hypothetical protein
MLLLLTGRTATALPALDGPGLDAVRALSPSPA